MKNTCSSEDCSVFKTLQLVGNKWVLIILFHLHNGPKRFGELQKQIEEISPKVLTQQLKKMEKEGLVNRKAFAEIPPRVEYSVTPKSMALAPILEKVIEWGLQYN